MPNLPERKVGLIACSGEDLPEGTVSREAALRVLERLRPGRTVTLCLPLFLAGEERERAFARFFPTIAIDGCEKRCAARATEMYSARPAVSVVVSELRERLSLDPPKRVRGPDEAREALALATAEALAGQVDNLLKGAPAPSSDAEARGAGTRADGGAPDALEETEAVCSCVSAIPVQSVEVDGRTLELVALPAVFALLHEEGKRPSDDGTAEALLDQVRIYNLVPPESEAALRRALLNAYEAFWARTATIIGEE
jgi:uncharacterized metal-binding protein